MFYEWHKFNKISLSYDNLSTLCKKHFLRHKDFDLSNLIIEIKVVRKYFPK